MAILVLESQVLEYQMFQKIEPQKLSLFLLKFIYSEKATKFFKIFPLLLTVCTVVKSKGKISQNVAAFSEYMNFKSEKLKKLKLKI